jgi:predicted nucleic acid-binding protein
MKASSFLGDRVYLDTNFIYCFIRPMPEYNYEILTFFKKIEEGRIHAYTCVSTFDELAYRLLLALIKDKYAVNPIDLLRKCARDMMKEFYPKIQSVLLELKSFPNLELLALTSHELFQMIYDLTYAKLMPRDMLHLAVMKNYGVSFIASDDRDFDGIEGVERIWLYNPPTA